VKTIASGVVKGFDGEYSFKGIYHWGGGSNYIIFINEENFEKQGD
jgi:hypothetical protein